MASVTKFPPNMDCPVCNIKLRPATQQEISLGLKSDDPQIKNIYSHAVQGDIDKRTLTDKTEETYEDPWDNSRGGWVMRCPDCDHISLFMSDA